MIFAKFGLALLQPVLYHAYFRIKYNIENEQCKCCRIIYFRIDNLLQSTSANWSVAYCCLKVFMIVHDKTIMGPSFWTETQRCFLTLISSTIFYSYHTISKSICFSVCSNILHIFHVIRLYHICLVHISDISNISVAHAVTTWVPCPFLVPLGPWVPWV